MAILPGMLFTSGLRVVDHPQLDGWVRVHGPIEAWSLIPHSMDCLKRELKVKTEFLGVPDVSDPVTKAYVNSLWEDLS